MSDGGRNPLMRVTESAPRKGGTMKKTSFAKRLELMSACPESIEWVGAKSAEEAWNTCENPSWMLWLLERTIEDRSDAHRRVVLCACDFARLTLPEWEEYAPDDKRPHETIATAEAFANEWLMKPESNEKSAADATRSVADAERSAADAARSAADAARSAATAARAADAVMSAAYAVMSAAYAARSAAYAARCAATAACCDIIRKHFPECPLQEKGNK